MQRYVGSSLMLLSCFMSDLCWKAHGVLQSVVAVTQHGSGGNVAPAPRVREVAWVRKQVRDSSPNSPRSN